MGNLPVYSTSRDTGKPIGGETRAGGIGPSRSHCLPLLSARSLSERTRVLPACCPALPGQWHYQKAPSRSGSCRDSRIDCTATWRRHGVPTR